MRIAICDDDEKELSHLFGLLAEYQLSRGISLSCHSFRNSMDFMYGMKGGEYDLILLDAEMPGESGVQIAREMRGLDKNVKLILTASSPDFAVESYNVGAYYYLLKPIDGSALYSLLDKTWSELVGQEEQGFVLRSRKGVVKISFHRLEYVEVVNKTVSFHLTNGSVYEITPHWGSMNRCF